MSLEKFQCLLQDLRLLLSFNVRSWNAVKLKMPAWQNGERGETVQQIVWDLYLWDVRYLGESVYVVYEDFVHCCIIVVEKKELKSVPNMRLFNNIVRFVFQFHGMDRKRKDITNPQNKVLDVHFLLNSVVLQHLYSALHAFILFM